MKHTFFMLLFISASLFTACQNSAEQQAEKTANSLQAVMKANDPGQVTTSDNGYFMKAIIDSKTMECEKYDGDQ